MLHIDVDDTGQGKRVDVLVAERYPQHARAALQKLFAQDLVLVKGKPVKAGYKLRAGDTVDIDDYLLAKEPDSIELPILFEDEDVIVINKPVGVLSHSKGAYNDEATVASFIRGKVNQDLATNRAGIVHRLDRATSGVMICAKNQAALSWLQKQFSQRRTRKTYTAIVKGTPNPAEAVIDVPIERHPKEPKTFRAHANGKSAKTHYRVLKTTDSHALLELKPETGRTHQLRVHMKYINHPIVGDILYGGEIADRLYLHARELELTLPNSERKVFASPLPPEFETFMKENK